MTWDDIYDKKYYDRYVKISKSELGQKIYEERWKLINSYIQAGTLLDYGCGPGAFNQAGPNEFRKFGYDINPQCGFTTIPGMEWDAVTFWDSLEHIPDYYSLLKRLKPKWLFITCPNIENIECFMRDWKHYRPGEHIHYFDRHSLKVILETLGYEIQEVNYAEGALRNPKDPLAIMTVVAKRAQ